MIKACDATVMSEMAILRREASKLNALVSAWAGFEHFVDEDIRNTAEHGIQYTVVDIAPMNDNANDVCNCYHITQAECADFAIARLAEYGYKCTRSGSKVRIEW